jgi:hypothetical protein
MQLKADFGLRHLVEVGTGNGDGVELAAALGFDHIHSIESQHKLALKTALRHSARQDITVIHGRSEKGLREALTEVPADAPVLFWLDIDYAGADARLQADPDARLERELRLIASLRDVSKDVFLVDDVTFYKGDLAFAAVILSGHQVERSPQGTGVLIAIPRGA